MKHTLFIAVLLMTFGAASGETWYVDGSVSSSGKGTSWKTAFKTIQEGIDAAEEGDRVRVAEGTYAETIDFKGKNITLASNDPLDPGVVDRTIIDGEGAGSVVTFSGKEEPGCVLSGFTIRYGKAEFGGGIAGHGATATIENNNITGNSADEGGGLHHCNGTIRDNVINANEALGPTYPTGYGGGLSSCDGTIQNNTISDNSARRGGGMSRCNGQIDNNTITANSAVRGGGLYDCDGAIQNNTITGNSAEEYGGGLAQCQREIDNNVITRNSAGSDGGGLYHCDDTIQDNIISTNSARRGGGLSACGGTIQNNIISRNSAQRGGGLSACGGTIQNNTIAWNSADQSGGGLSYCNGLIRSNMISRNEAHGTYPYGTGGGLDACGGTIEGNTIANNSSDRSGGGLANCSATIQGNVITENSANVGGGLDVCDGPIQKNLVLRNTAGVYGGGLAFCDIIEGNTICGNAAVWTGGGLSHCLGTIQNNIISTNSANSGGGLDGCDGIVRNNTVTGNSASSRGGGLVSCQGTIQNCVIWGNAADEDDQLSNSSVPTYSCIQGWGGGEGNISSDPRFVDRDGPDNDLETYEDNDYRLSPGSPCIDAGDNAGLNPPGFDFDGNLRIVFGEHSVSVDMGAFEYNSGTIQIAEILPLGGSGIHLKWRSQPNDTYTVWSCPDLPTGTWTEEGTVLSQGAETPWTDIAASGQMKFYRVEMK